MESQIASLDGEYEKNTTIMSKQGEECHKEIDSYQSNEERNKRNQSEPPGHLKRTFRKN